MHTHFPRDRRNALRILSDAPRPSKEARRNLDRLMFDVAFGRLTPRQVAEDTWFRNYMARA